MHAPTEGLEHVLDQFSEYNMNILLDFSAKLGAEDILKEAAGEFTR
jgi:hypothetical protein